MADVLTEPEILLEEPDFVAVSKPAGWIAVPGRNAGGAPCLVEWARARFEPSVLPVHRLDRDTSGAIVLARTAAAHRALSVSFERREVEKVYLALVAGMPPQEGAIDTPLCAARRGKARPARPGETGARAARTRFRAIERFADCSLLELIPETGRHHQIRVHMRSIGHPLLLDACYGARHAPAGLPELVRLPLHAARLTFPHPAVPERRVVVEAPLPPDLAAVLARLRGAAPH